MSDIVKQLAVIQQKLKCEKSQFNKFGGYRYRSIEDIEEAVKPLLGDLILTFSDEIKEAGGLVYCESIACLTDGKSEVTTKAQAGINPNRKGMDIAQSFGSSSSYSRKYAASALFLIDDTKDSDSTNDHKPNTVEKAPSSHYKQTKSPPSTSEPKKISDAQRRRLLAIKTNNKLTDDEVKLIIKQNGFESSKDITTDKYEEVIDCIEIAGGAKEFE